MGARFDYQPQARRWPVRQFGPRRLWDEVVAAYQKWDQLGQPPVTRWQFSLTPHGQHVTLTSAPAPVHAPCD